MHSYIFVLQGGLTSLSFSLIDTISSKTSAAVPTSSVVMSIGREFSNTFVRVLETSLALSLFTFFCEDEVAVEVQTKSPYQPAYNDQVFFHNDQQDHKYNISA